VLRAYDNRAYPTDRRPDVYLRANETGRTGVVCDLVEGRERSDDDFGCTQEGDDSCSWLWKEGRRISSRLLVIFTAFWEGRHYAKSVLEFVPLVEHMQGLHRKDFVHGDVRCFNIIFNPESSCLIDFDFGGKVKAAGFDAKDARIEGAELQSDSGKEKGDDGKERKAAELKYPRGYRTDLPDGKRLGLEGNLITKFNDAFDLTYVIFGLHKVLPPALDEPAGESKKSSEESGDSAPDPLDQAFIEESTMEQQIKMLQELKERGKMLQEERILLKERDSLASVPSINFAPAQMEDYAAQHLEKVKAFLQKVAAADWTVSPEARYMLVLQRHGLHSTSDPETHHQGGNDTATGSPPKNDPP
jgi:hypothetical protein